MLVLLAVVALASRSHQPFRETSEAREPSTAFWDYAFTGFVVLMVLGSVLLVYVYATNQGSRKHPALSGRGVVPIIAFVAVIAAVIVAVRLVRGNIGPEQPSPVVTTSATPTRAETAREELPTPYEPEIRWSVIVFVGLAGATALAFLLWRRLSAKPGDASDALTEELGAVLDDTLDDLRAEPDPRRAVIAAYARMERSLAAHGLPRRRAEAPLEFLDRASQELHARHPPARRLLFELTHLFERAKFSPHAIDAEMKDDAIATLTSLRSELRGSAA